MANYGYLYGSFPGEINFYKLTDEAYRSPNIQTALENVQDRGTFIEFVYAADLSQDEKNTLDAIVASHDPVEDDPDVNMLTSEYNDAVEEDEQFTTRTDPTDVITLPRVGLQGGRYKIEWSGEYRVDHANTKVDITVRVDGVTLGNTRPFMLAEWQGFSGHTVKSLPVGDHTLKIQMASTRHNRSVGVRRLTLAMWKVGEE